MIQAEGEPPKPLPSKEPKIDRSWTAGGRDWLWENNSGRSRHNLPGDYSDDCW